MKKTLDITAIIIGAKFDEVAYDLTNSTLDLQEDFDVSKRVEWVGDDLTGLFDLIETEYLLMVRAGGVLSKYFLKTLFPIIDEEPFIDVVQSECSNKNKEHAKGFIEHSLCRKDSFLVPDRNDIKFLKTNFVGGHCP